jgi:stearoyl-CoA desaturase (delta-9 desaturase)
MQLKKDTPFESDDKPVITQESFEARIQSGEKLVILNDLVLDVTGFGHSHPGGSHVIEQNIGRDISKFFYGGYILSNGKYDTPHTHSNIAR